MMPRLTPAVKFIILLSTGVYFLQLLFPRPVFDWLALQPGDVQHGRVWELFTYMFVHSLQPFHILMNMMTLFFFGGEVESAWGTKRFTSFYALCGAGAGLTALFLDPQHTLVGSSGAVFGVMVAFALLFPDAVIYFFGMIPMRAPVLVLIFIGIELAMLAQPSSQVSSWAHLGGAGVGFLYVRFSWRIGNWWKRTNAARRASTGPVPITSRRSPRPPARPSRGGGPPTKGTVSTLPTSSATKSPSIVAASAEELAIQQRADKILDKISRNGMESLSPEERELLHRHSQILRSREGDVLRLDDYRS